MSPALHSQEQEQNQTPSQSQDNNEFSPEIKITTRSTCQQLYLDFSPKLKLKTLFIFYSSFGTRLNLTHLSLQKFQKLLQDANILDERLNAHELNIIVLQTIHSRVTSIDFQVFLDLLPKISVFKFNLIENNIAAFEALLEHHLFPLFQCIIEQTDLGKQLQIMNQPLEESTVKIMLHLAPQFTKLYDIYFKQELGGGCQKSDLIIRSLKSLSKFLQEFEICPPLISKSVMNVVYYNIIEIDVNSPQLITSLQVTKVLQQQNLGNGIIFTFNRFLTFIIRAAIISFNSFNEVQQIANEEDLMDEQSQSQKILFLLNRMQISSGFQMVEKRTDRPHQQRFTFQIPNQKLEQLLGISQSQSQLVRQSQIQQYHSPSMSSFNQFGFFISQQQTNQSIHLKQQLFLNPSSMTLQNSRSQQQFFTDENLSNIPQDAPMTTPLLNPQLCAILDFHQSSLVIFQQNHEQLLKIFQYYCSLGEPLNISKLKSFKLAKLLKQVGLLQQNSAESRDENTGQTQLSLTDMDLIFSKLTGTKLQQLIQENSNQPKWDKSIQSPNLGERRHLSQVDKGPNNKNCMGKLEFEQFLKALELITIKLYPDSPLSDSLPLIINNHIIQQDLQNPQQVKERAAGTYHIQLLMSLLNDHDVVSLLNEVHKPIELIYTNYCDYKQLMNFDQFINFSKDFNLFPDIISKSKLLRIFYALSTIYQSQNQELSMQQSSILKSTYGLSTDSLYLKDQFNTVSHQNNFIDNHLFVESIALCALEVPYFEPQPNNMEKVIYLLQRLNSTNKYQSIQKQLGYKTKNSFKLNLLAQVIKKYTSILSVSNFYDEEPETFEDFIKQTKFEK